MFLERCLELNKVEIKPKTSEEELIERLSELEHIQWEDWSKELAKHLEEWKTDLPEQPEEVIEKINNRLSRWETNWKPYSKLDEKTKDYDRKWAKIVLEEVKKLWLPANKVVLIADVKKMIGEWLGIDRGEFKITINNNIVGFKKLIKKLNSLKK